MTAYRYSMLRVNLSDLVGGLEPSGLDEDVVGRERIEWLKENLYRPRAGERVRNHFLGSIRRVRAIREHGQMGRSAAGQGGGHPCSSNPRRTSPGPREPMRREIVDGRQYLASERDRFAHVPPTDWPATPRGLMLDVPVPALLEVRFGRTWQRLRPGRERHAYPQPQAVGQPVHRPGLSTLQ
jgi:hypothetical protein